MANAFFEADGAAPAGSVAVDRRTFKLTDDVEYSVCVVDSGVTLDCDGHDLSTKERHVAGRLLNAPQPTQRVGGGMLSYVTDISNAQIRALPTVHVPVSPEVAEGQVIIPTLLVVQPLDGADYDVQADYFNQIIVAPEGADLQDADWNPMLLSADMVAVGNVRFINAVDQLMGVSVGLPLSVLGSRRWTAQLNDAANVVAQMTTTELNVRIYFFYTLMDLS